MICSVSNCRNTKHYARGWCAKHYRKWRIYGDPLAGKEYDMDTHGTIDTSGYRILTVNGVRVKEHRYLMEQFIGRKLLSHENVHHINGQKADNRIENLEIWSTSQPKGQRIQDKLDWAYEIIALYEKKQ